MAQTTIRFLAHALGFKQSTIANSDFNLLGPVVSPSDLELRSQLPTIASAVSIGATAYFVYLGKANRKLTAQKVQFHLSTAGTSTQVGEVGVFSTPSAPNGAAQTLTKLMASGTLDDLTAVGVKGNATAFATDIPAGTHIWAGYRVDMAGTEPGAFGLTDDRSSGRLLALASAGVMTSTSTYAGALIAVAASAPVWQAPALSLTVT